jgi:carboxyl-terminal processing protease
VSTLKRFLRRAFSLEAVATFSLLIISFYLLGIHIGKSEGSNSKLDQVLAAVEQQDTGRTDQQILESAAINGLLKATGDRWASYFPKASAGLLSQSLQGLYSGVGLWLRSDNKNRGLEISAVQPNSPADKAGIKPLDHLLSIDGVSARNQDVATVVALLRGNSGTRVALQLSRGTNQYRVSIVRATLANSQVEAAQIAPGILYLQLTAFTANDAYDIESALGQYHHNVGVILDLRNNPGGLINQAQEIASVFLGKGVVVTYNVRGSDTQTLSASNPNPDRSPLIVLVNKATASSAEILASSLQENDRAIVVGEETFGKGVIQEITSLSDGSQVVLTVGQYLTANGSRLNGVGLRPDLMTSDQLSLKKSIAILTGLHKSLR